ncbi:MAG TPA: T9SS type A sorting domain-containing protein [Cytophagaceae bacterium]|jgi:hypothetical protein
MKKIYINLSLVIIFISLSLNTLFASSIDIKDETKLSISQPQTTESLQVKDKAKLTISSPGALTVRGKEPKEIVDLKNEAFVSVNQNGTLIIFGDVIIKDEAELLIYGKVIIYGNLQIKDKAQISGNGQLVVTGTIEKKDEAGIVASVKVSKDAAIITSTNDVLNVDVLSNEKATIAIYNIQGQLLSLIENSESIQVDLNKIPAKAYEVLVVKVNVGEKVYSSKIVKM